jgi:hypothetical protein
MFDMYCTVGWVDIGIKTKVPLRFVTYLSKVGLGRKHFFDLSRKQKLTKGVTVFAKFCQFFAKVSQSDEKWYKISVEKEYMEPDPCFLASWIRIRIRIHTSLSNKHGSGLGSGSRSWSYLRRRQHG